MKEVIKNSVFFWCVSLDGSSLVVNWFLVCFCVVLVFLFLFGVLVSRFLGLVS